MISEEMVDLAARAVLKARGHGRFLTSPGLYRLPIWLRAKRDARAALEAVPIVSPSRDDIADVLDRAGAQVGGCGHEPGEGRDCAHCWPLLLRYADAILAAPGVQPAHAALIAEAEARFTDSRLGKSWARETDKDLAIMRRLIDALEGKNK
ncbi:hypothetical protein [Microbacterium sp. YY-01]|uniref:hypothetical protein n=1 Tax=Microbacterium sp. YY-01 TaxID=3421634 RepID=UPI003D182175